MNTIEGLQFHHIGYAVKSIEETADFYLAQGWTLTNSMTDPIQKAFIAFLKRDGFPLIELVAPIDETSPVVKTLEKMGVSTYHVCYCVENIVEAVSILKKQRFLPLFNPVEAIALDNHKICYLYNKQVGLIELVEK